MLTSSVRAEGNSRGTSLALGARALPGYWKVELPPTQFLPVTIRAAAGYGFTESQALAPGSHHRFDGKLTVAGQPLNWLGLSASSRLQHDRHRADEFGSDTGTLWESDLHATFGGALDANWRLGAAWGSRFTQGDSLADSVANPTVDVAILGSFVPPNQPYSVGALAGYRYDRAAGAIGDPSRFRSGDRSSLGLSQFDALLLGVGGSIRMNRFQYIAELSANILIGTAAPELLKSPLRATVAAGYSISSRLALRLAAGASLSKALSDKQENLLVPLEPRVAIRLGLEYTFAEAAEVVVVPPPPRPIVSAPSESLVEPSATVSLDVAVTSPDGHPISDATVVVSRADLHTEVPHSSRAVYRHEELAPGRYTLRIQAARLAEAIRQIDVTKAGPNLFEVQLEVAAPAGQIRGLVRSLQGLGLAAQVRIEPIGTTVSTHVDGTFSVDVPPGNYQVVVQAEGHQTQKRTVIVQIDGVVVLNADMQVGSP